MPLLVLDLSVLAGGFVFPGLELKGGGVLSLVSFAELVSVLTLFAIFLSRWKVAVVEVEGEV